MIDDRSRLLIVDDDPAALRWFHDLFAGAGYKIFLADSGAAALAGLAGAAPDLALIDVSMPGMDGYTVCAGIKADPSFAGVPVILLSVADDGETKLRALRSGAVDFIRKPFVAEEALLRVRNHLELFRLRRGLEAEVGRRTAELEAALDANRILLGELRHRVKNNLGMIHSLVELSADSPKAAAARPALIELAARVRSISYLYDQLHDAGGVGSVDFGAYLERLVAGLAALNPRAVCSVEAAALILPIGRAAPLGLMVTELVTNALKYAFPGERRGRVVVSLSVAGTGADASGELAVGDDGVGLPPDFDQERDADFGLAMIAGLCQQIGAEFAVAPGGGTPASGVRASLRFGIHTAEVQR
jgi:two-component sensor histidine kinase